MNSPKISCLLSAGVMLAATFPALAQHSVEWGLRDRQPQGEPTRQHYYQRAARDGVGRLAYVDRQRVPHGYYGPGVYHGPGVYYGPPAYYQPPNVVYAPAYYYDPPAYYAAPPSYPFYVYRSPPVAAVELPPPPPPRPARAVAPAAKRFTLSADALFDFDQAVLKPEGIRQLDNLAADLKGADYDRVKVHVITVTGHTDRLGSDSYNMQLSIHRAEAVKDHLMKLGIAGARIVATGEGETYPVTKRDECRDDQVTRELIACLQPDRRVEIEVSLANDRGSAQNYPPPPPSGRAPVPYGPQAYR